ncbi:ornithine cyclodeaminase family protein [Halalkalicoccus jeotgali]|uniref:Ornithine cyclodeaminase n=1 Tax=Halalkalicoccus jeotgali (strain DSM 18796 / CECT 7217 / JCM 14584 / KCTC 4019 / B3) TaxID=795797 RepID=D8J2D0_HALJB|nr:ornithine cyclodeaminase family protein [Halalkalicoccus jeotgali]ADJ14887.1 ornithine cyclodeaminase [Halalkalicoccus jeotgali B3]ELY39469.1 ornithine cyclodeaminase [Halalkalicoccus jeotgali B3]
MVRILSDADVDVLLDLEGLLPVVEEAFVKQGRGEVERPDRPHFPVGVGLESDDPLGTGLTMPAYIHGEECYATKLASVHPDNPDRGLATVNAQIAVTDARTGQARAYMDGTRVTGARTGCIGGLAARDLAGDPLTVGVIGAGTQARWGVRAIATGSSVESVRIHSPSDSRERCASDLAGRGLPAKAVDSPTEAVTGADVVLTATPSEQPVFPGNALEPDALVVAVGAYNGAMRELDAETIERAEAVLADVPEEVIRTGDLRESGLEVGDLVPFADVFEGRFSRPNGIVVLCSVGSAVLDAATATHLVERAEREEVGTTVDIE